MLFKIIFDFNVYFYGKYVKIPYEMKISMCMQMRIQDFFFQGTIVFARGFESFYSLYLLREFSFEFSRGKGFYLGPLEYLNYLLDPLMAYIYLYAPLCKMDLLKCYCLYIVW